MRVKISKGINMLNFLRYYDSAYEITVGSIRKVHIYSLFPGRFVGQEGSVGVRNVFIITAPLSFSV